MISSEPAQLQRLHVEKTQTERYYFKIPPLSIHEFNSLFAFLN